MSANFVEELMLEYYRLKGYMVSSNYWFPIQTQRNRTQNGIEQEYSAQSWSDLDVIAIGKNEVVLVQVKAIVNNIKDAEKIKKFFERAETFIHNGKAPDQTGSIAWWSAGRTIKKLLVYEIYSAPSYLKPIRDAGIEVKEFSECFDEIVEYIKKKRGVKEESPLMRMVHFMNKNYEVSKRKAKRVINNQ